MNGRTRAQKILTSITFLSVLAAMGCGTYSPVSPSQENSTAPGVENPLFVRLLPTSKGSNGDSDGEVISMVVSAAEGGEISNGYYSLYFPPGALKEDTEITIEMPQYPYAVVRLGPHGIQFQKSVTMSLELDALDSNASDYKALWYNEETGLWEDIGSYLANGSVKAELEHFSEYGHEPRPGTSP